MSNLVFGPCIGQLYTALSEIAGNIEYMRQAFPADDLPDADHKRLDHLCGEWEGAIYDVRKEIRNLEDKLGMHPGEEPFDPDIMNPDPHVTMGFINDWLWTEIEAMNQTIVDLRPRAGDTDALGSIWLLVTESAVNILNAFSVMQKSLASIAAEHQRTGAVESSG